MPLVINTVKEVFGRQYSDDPTVRRAVRIFRVTTNTPVYFMTDLIDDPSLPPLGEIYSFAHPELRCVDRQLAEIGRSNTEFELTLRYDQFPFNDWAVKITSQQVEGVLDRTAEQTADRTKIPQRFQDIPGIPRKYLSTQPLGSMNESVLNRAKDAFDPPVMGYRTQIVISADTMVDAIADLGNPGFDSVGDLEKLVGKVNSKPITIFSIPDETSLVGCDYWTLLLEEATVTKIRSSGGCAFLVSLRIVYDPLSHCPVVLNAGYNELLESGTPNEKRRKIRDAGQVEVSSPMPLDEDGEAIDPKFLPQEVTYIICPSHETFDFALLGLPVLFCSPAPTPTPAP